MFAYRCANYRQGTFTAIANSGDDFLTRKHDLHFVVTERPRKSNTSEGGLQPLPSETWLINVLSEIVALELYRSSGTDSVIWRRVTWYKIADRP